MAEAALAMRECRFCVILNSHSFYYYNDGLLSSSQFSDPEMFYPVKRFCRGHLAFTQIKKVAQGCRRATELNLFRDHI